VTFEDIEDFEDGVADLFTGYANGMWSVSSERYGVTPNGETGINLLDLGPDNLNFNSYLELNAVVNTAGRAGFVFDRYGDDSFKFAAINADSDELVIGHYTSKSGWVKDAVFSTVIEAGTDYTLGVTLKGTTVSATLNAAETGGFKALLGYTFNSATVDGNFGLLATGAAASFDDVNVKTDDPALIETDGGDNLMASAAPEEPVGVDSFLTQEDLTPIIDEAIARWAEALSLDDAAIAMLEAVTFVIVDFDDLTLGQQTGDRVVLLDADAAGYGWFIDETPFDDDEFVSQTSDGDLEAASTEEAFGHMDLLTVVMHELGHILGFEDVDPEAHNLMSATLDASVRCSFTGDTSTDTSVSSDETDAATPNADLPSDNQDSDTNSDGIPDPPGNGKAKNK
jgi:hypothetical protein